MANFADVLPSERMGIALEAVKRKSKNESFQHLLNPTHSLSLNAPDYTVYNPNFLDDPELKTGKHRTVITLPSFIVSLALPVRFMGMTVSNYLEPGLHHPIHPTRRHQERT
jgi:hypothetical protein